MIKEKILPEVSIIIPCYNQAKYISYAIESALNQTYKNIQIVCINDASSDESSLIIREYAKKYRNILFFDETKSCGLCAVKDMAITVSNGKYILPLNVNDNINCDYVEKAVNILENNPEIDTVYCKSNFFEAKNKLKNLQEYDEKRIIFEELIFNCSLFRKKDYNEFGGYKEYIKNACENWDLWVLYIEKGFKVYKINKFHNIK